MIQNEGLDTLSESELRSACRERGMLGMRSVEEMRQQVTLFFCWCIFTWFCPPIFSLGFLCRSTPNWSRVCYLSLWFLSAVLLGFFLVWSYTHLVCRSLIFYVVWIWCSCGIGWICLWTTLFHLLSSFYLGTELIVLHLRSICRVAKLSLSVASRNTTETQNADICIYLCLKILGKILCTYWHHPLGTDEVSGERHGWPKT